MRGAVALSPPLLLARAAWGATLLLAPRAVLRRCGDPPGRAVRAGARLLGARHLAEAALRRRFAAPQDTIWFRAVDLSHAATMALLGVARPPYRRAAFTSLAVSGILGALD